MSRTITPQTPSPSPARVYTLDDLLEMPDNIEYELVDGRLVRLNLGYWSQFVGTRLSRWLGNHCEPGGLAYVAMEAGFTCFPNRPNRMRKPDVSVVLSHRLTPELREEGFLPIRPDLAIEVTSPNDTIDELEKKLVDYRNAEIPLVWIIIPSTRRVRVLPLGGPTLELGLGDELTGEPILPGFRCLVSDLFAGLPAEPNPAPANPG